MNDPLKEDFRNFLYVCMKALGYDPAPLQYDVAHYLQHGPPRRGVTALRNFGKSYITAMFANWLLYCNPNTRIMCVSGNGNRAAEFIRLCRKLLTLVPELNHLAPREGDKDGAFKFDCGARTNVSKDPSISAYGITSMMTGAHVDHIIADDVETPHNSDTVESREKLYIACLEFEAILNPGGTITYLGTPQNRSSIYNELGKHYQFRRWPARYPDPNSETGMKNLAPTLVAHLLEGVAQAGQTTYVERFPEHILMEREAIMGPTVFALQMLLDTSLADANKYPLKLRDFVVHPVGAHMAPAQMVWGTSPVQDIPSVGLKGDNFNGPIFWSKDKYVEFQHCIMFIDPAGTGNDELGYCVARLAAGMIYIPAAGGLTGGYEDNNLLKIASICKLYQVRKIWVESNFGDGMFERLLAPKIAQVCGPIGVEGIPSGNKQKEFRIIDTLEPLLHQHRVVIDPSVAGDSKLMTQLTSITREKNSLKGIGDDRLEALAGACAQFVDSVSVNPEQLIKDNEEKKKADAVNDFFKTWHRGKQGRSVVKGSLIYEEPEKNRARKSGNWLSTKRR